MSNSVKVTRGQNGFGGPIILTATEKRNKILMVTGEKSNPVAEKISKLTGATIIDGFTTGIPLDEILVAIVDCTGTSRSGIYPKKKIKTINISVAADYGHLADYIIENYYVSDVDISSISETTDIETSLLSDDDSTFIENHHRHFLPTQNIILQKKSLHEKKGIKSVFKNIFK